MAVTKTKTDTKLMVVLDTGETKGGKAVTKTVTYSTVKNSASDEELLAAGNALGSLCAQDLDSVSVTEIHALTESV